MIELKKVDTIQVDRNYHFLQVYIKDFMKQDFEICELKFKIGEDYKSVDSAVNSIRIAVKRSGENVKVHRRKDRIFLKKTLSWAYLTTNIEVPDPKTFMRGKRDKRAEISISEV